MSSTGSIKKYTPKLGRREIFTITLLAIELLVFSLISENFLTFSNLRSVLRNATDMAVVSIGMTMVIILGGIDISVGSALGVVAIVVGWLIQAQVNPLLIALVGILVGTLIGLLNGVLITYGRIPDIIATLGMSNILRAVVFGMLGGRWLTGLPPVFGPLAQGLFFGIPSSVFILVFFYALFWYLLTHRPFGRHIYAVGNSLEAATLAGIDARRTRVLSYAILGSLVGFASLLYVGRLGSVEITVGIDLPIACIAAVFIGGASVLGGRGSVIGTLAGVLFMAVMKNGVVLLGIPSLWERAVVGALIILSALADLAVNRRSELEKRRQLYRQRQATTKASVTWEGA
jgi:ribose transport system permease protein/AI-2 transport system permease protein